MITLNLISPEKKQELKMRQLYIMIKNIIILILLVTIISSIILLLSRMIIQNNFNRIVEQSTLTTKYANIFNKEIKEFNLYINGLSKIQEEYVSWTKFMIEFSELLPEKINLYTLDIKSNKLLITGFASDRDSLKKFKENLEANQLFSNVEIPLNNLIKKESIDFNIKAEINLDQLEKI